MILRALGCMYLSGWLIETVTTVGKIHKDGLKLPKYHPVSHYVALSVTIPVIMAASLLWPFFWWDRCLPESVRRKRRLEARARQAKRLRNKGKRK